MIFVWLAEAESTLSADVEQHTIACVGGGELPVAVILREGEGLSCLWHHSLTFDGIHLHILRDSRQIRAAERTTHSACRLVNEDDDVAGFKL